MPRPALGEPSFSESPEAYCIAVAVAEEAEVDLELCPAQSRVTIFALARRAADRPRAPRRVDYEIESRTFPVPAGADPAAVTTTVANGFIVIKAAKLVR